MHFTPTGCSWLNMVERFFRDLTENRLRRGAFRSVEELIEAIGEYIDHRLTRERRLLAALAAGARSIPEMLDAAWSDVPELMRPAATVTLAAHLDKLADEGRLPAGVERPDLAARTPSEPRPV